MATATNNFLIGGNDQNSCIVGFYPNGYMSTGSNSIAIGYEAGFTGQQNGAIAIGRYAGRTNQIQNSIIINASGTDVGGTTASSCYISPIRTVVTGTTSSNIMVYDTTTKEVQTASTLTFAGDITALSYFSSSDIRLKTNIQSFPPVLEKVRRLDPVQFDWKNSGKPDYGFLAQQFYKEFDFLKEAHNYHGEEFPRDTDGKDIYYSMEYQKVTAILCKAIQELDAKVDKLQKQLNAI